MALRPVLTSVTSYCHAHPTLGERGPVWWTDGAPDYNRRMVANTPYSDWFAALPIDG